MGDTGRRHNADENLDDIPLPPPATNQPARLRDYTSGPFSGTSVSNQYIGPGYYVGYGDYSANEASRPHQQMPSNRQSGHENCDQRLCEDFSENSTPNRYQSAENLQPIYPERQSNIVPPDTSREMLSKMDSILNIAQKLHARVTQLEDARRQTVANVFPDHLPPRQVDPMHNERLQNKLQNAFPRRVLFQEPFQRPSAPRLTSPKEFIDQRSSSQDNDRRSSGQSETSQRPDRVYYPACTSREQFGENRIAEINYRRQAQMLLPDNVGHERAGSGGNGNIDLRCAAPNDLPASSGLVATQDSRSRSNYTRDRNAGSVSGASKNRLAELLLRSTVSSQIKNLPGLQGVSATKDWFRQFEGLTDGWTEAQRMNLLGLKVVESARLTFEAYENEVITPVYWEAKRAILEAVAAEDSRPISAWNDLKTLQQKPFQSVADFGRHVKWTVSKALGDSLSAMQIELFCKNYFVDGLCDLGIRRALAGQQERSRYTDLVREGALIERSCPTKLPSNPAVENVTYQERVSQNGNYLQNSGDSGANYQCGTDPRGTWNKQPWHSQKVPNQDQGELYEVPNFGPPKGFFNKNGTRTGGYQYHSSEQIPENTGQADIYQNQQGTNDGKQSRGSETNDVSAGQNFLEPRHSEGPRVGNPGQDRQ